MPIQETELTIVCPRCGFKNPQSAETCQKCMYWLEGAKRRLSNDDNGLPAVRMIEPAKPAKPWYRSTWVMVALFLGLTPVWLILVLTDSEISTKNKVLAVLLVLLVLACNFWILPNMFSFYNIQAKPRT